MKILIVTCLLPYPTVTHGGGVDLFHLIEALSVKHEVHLLSIISEPDVVHLPDIRPFCTSVQVVIPSWNVKQKMRQVWQGLWRHPLMLGRRAQTEIRAHIRRIITKFDIDVVQFEWTEMGKYIDVVKSVGRPATILDEVDVSFRPVEYRLERRKLPFALPFHRWKSRRARNKELALCRRFDAVLTRSEYDRRVLLSYLPNSRVEVFQPWTHVNQFAGIDDWESQPGRLLFVGAMDRDENCEAVLYFYHQIFPDVKRVYPEAEFWIAGANPQPQITHLAQDPAVKVTGYVTSLRHVYAACDVFVAPMQVPGGVFNKIVDAMAAGRPVVTTPIGNEGIGAVPNESICIAGTPAEFASQTLALLGDRELWRKIASRGREHVQHLYDWETNVSRLEALYQQLVAYSDSSE